MTPFDAWLGKLDVLELDVLELETKELDEIKLDELDEIEFELDWLELVMVELLFKDEVAGLPLPPPPQAATDNKRVRDKARLKRVE